MDDQAKKQTTIQNPIVASDDVQQPTQVPSVGTGSKETGIYVEQVSERPVLPTEVQPFVEHSEPETPSHEHVAPAADSTKVNLNPTSTVLPMSDKQIEEALKKGPGDDKEVQKGITEGLYFADSQFFLAKLLTKIQDRLGKILKPGQTKLSPKPV